MKISTILGLNSRSQLFSYKYNTFRGKKIAASKLLTGKFIKKGGLPVPLIYHKFKKPSDVFDFDWNNLPERFVIKPNKGLGGEGIIVVKKKSRDGKNWITTQKEKLTTEDFKLHILDILEGAYSFASVPDIAFIQEYIGRHKAFRRYAYRGTPDIRVIVFNKVPIMAMLRLPTKESGGRANLHQGAIGVGIDIATGITTKAIFGGNHIHYKPETRKKLRGIKIPHWNEVLRLAAKASVIAGLGYVGVDIVLHPDKGAMVLELNSQPGLQIQLANLAGLKKRLERVEDLEVRDYEHGVEIAKALFAARFADRVKAEEGVKILNSVEEVKIYYYSSKKKTTVLARIDTGAFRSSIDKNLAIKLGLLTRENVLWKDRFSYRSATGLQTRPVIGIKIVLAGRKISTSASVSDRSKLTAKFLVGRNDLTGFLVSLDEKDQKNGT